jgi:hypothetical protein
MREGVVVPTLVVLLLWDKATIAGRVAGIDGGDRAGELTIGLGLRLLKLPIGLAKPLFRPLSKTGDAGETTATWSPTSMSSIPAKIAAALSRTEGTEFSSCSVPFERGIRCGLWVIGGDGEMIGSISRSNMADDDECTEVGDDGMKLGGREPNRISEVRRC